MMRFDLNGEHLGGEGSDATQAGAVRITPEEELQARISTLQGSMAAGDLDGALIVQNTDLFYFSGTAQQAHLYVPASGEPFLLVRRNLERAREESRLKRILPLKSPREIIPLLKENGYAPPGKIGMELDVIPAAAYFKYREYLAPSEVTDVSALVRTVRAVKSPYEIGILRKGARVWDEMFRRAREALREGMTEVELAAEVEAAGRRAGHQGVVHMRAFNQEIIYGHLLSGPGATVPSCIDSPTGGRGLNPLVPQGAGWRRIRRGEPVLLDFVAALDGYLVDQTRILSLGRLPESLVRAYRTAVEIQEELARSGRPGTLCGGLYDRAVAMAAKAGLAENFMGFGPNRAAFVGHGIGLELDEYPAVARGLEIPIQAGMVLALEPKFIFPGLGVVGIEDTYVVTEQGLSAISFSEREIATL